MTSCSLSEKGPPAPSGAKHSRRIKRGSLYVHVTACDRIYKHTHTPNPLPEPDLETADPPARTTPPVHLRRLAPDTRRTLSHQKTQKRTTTKPKQKTKKIHTKLQTTDNYIYCQVQTTIYYMYVFLSTLFNNLIT